MTLMVNVRLEPWRVHVAQLLPRVSPQVFRPESTGNTSKPRKELGNQTTQHTVPGYVQDKSSRLIASSVQDKSQGILFKITPNYQVNIKQNLV